MLGLVPAYRSTQNLFINRLEVFLVRLLAITKRFKLFRYIPEFMLRRFYKHETTIINTILYVVDGNSLFFGPNGTLENQIDFPIPIADVLAFGEMLVVRLKTEPGVIFNENVFGVHLDGTLCWTVPYRTNIDEDNPFVGIWKKGQNACLSNWDGMQLIINPATGEILEKSWHK